MNTNDLEIIEEVVELAASIHRTASPDYAWSECADCGTETGKHSEECVVGKAYDVIERIKNLR